MTTARMKNANWARWVFGWEWETKSPKTTGEMSRGEAGGEGKEHAKNTLVKSPKRNQ